MNAIVLVVLAAIVVGSLAPLIIMVIVAMHWSRASWTPSLQQGDALYADRLIEIWPDYMVFFNYYLLGREKAKFVSMDEIKRIWTTPCTLRTGKWRIHGTGDFRTWFPQDINRPKRDRIFFLELSTQRTRIGFTVERADAVETLLKEKGLLDRKEP